METSLSRAAWPGASAEPETVGTLVRGVCGRVQAGQSWRMSCEGLRHPQKLPGHPSCPRTGSSCPSHGAKSSNALCVSCSRQSVAVKLTVEGYGVPPPLGDSSRDRVSLAGHQHSHDPRHQTLGQSAKTQKSWRWPWLCQTRPLTRSHHFCASRVSPINHAGGSPLHRHGEQNSHLDVRKVRGQGCRDKTLESALTV